jgi:hypothetical protein
MTTEWVSGGGNPFCHHDLTQNGFPVVEMNFVNRKQGIYLNPNLPLLFFNVTTEWVSGGGNPFCHHDLNKWNTRTNVM